MPRGRKKVSESVKPEENKSKASQAQAKKPPVKKKPKKEEYEPRAVKTIKKRIDEGCSVLLSVRLSQESGKDIKIKSFAHLSEIAKGALDKELDCQLHIKTLTGGDSIINLKKDYF